MTPKQMEDADYLVSLHAGIHDDDTPIAILSLRPAIERIRTLEAELAGYKESHETHCPAAVRVKALEAAARRLVISAGGITIHSDLCDTCFYGNGRIAKCDCGADELRALLTLETDSNV